MDLKGKVALIVGGATGIGYSTAVELLRNGVKVVLIDSNVDAVKSENRVVLNKVDIINKNEIEDAFKKVINTFGTIDIVFNNAQITNETEWETMIDVNLKSTISVAYLVQRYLGRHNGGMGCVLVNTSSAVAFTQEASMLVYNATTSGVLGFSRELGQQFLYVRSGIRIITICPEVDLLPLYHADTSKHVVNIIKTAENNTVWLLQGGKRYLLRTPNVKILDMTDRFTCM